MSVSPRIGVIALTLMFGTASAGADDCWPRVGPLLGKSDGKLTAEVRAAYLDWAEQAVLEDLRKANRPVAADVLAEVRGNPTLRDAMFAAVYPPDPSVLENYNRLRPVVGSKYVSLAAGLSVARRTHGVEKDQTLDDCGRPFQAGFWTDESLHSIKDDGERAMVGLIAEYMKSKNVAAADLYEDGGKQHDLAAYLADHNVSAKLTGEIKKSMRLGNWLKSAMVSLGQRPGARDARPDVTEWAKYLVKRFEGTPSSVPKGQTWPPFPIDKSPWPLLMPLEHEVPITEADYVWEMYQGEHGPDRYHTYGPYRGDDDVMAHSLGPSRWFWDAWPDEIVHGGECVPISKATVDLYSALVKPAVWAGQPGHANLISFQHVNGSWTAEIEQAFAGGPDVTFAQWFFDEKPGTQLRFRDLYYWAGAEYHLGLALAMNTGLTSYMDTRIAAHLLGVMPAADKATIGVKLLTQASVTNPYNAEIWYRLGENSPTAAAGMKVMKAVLDHEPSSPGRHEAVERATGQYWRTVAQFEAEFAVMKHPPTTEPEMGAAYALLKETKGIGPKELAKFIEEFAAARPAGLSFDQTSAAKGDPYGLLRMGQRFAAGDGVGRDESKARDFLTKATAKGDVVASLALARLVETVPGDQITVSTSSVFGQDQAAKHLIDGAGMTGFLHDDEKSANTMWQSAQRPAATSPGRGIAPSPAWARFDFARPTKVEAVMIWNMNQPKLTDRGFRKTRLYGSTDGSTWFALTRGDGIELPRAGGTPAEAATTVATNGDRPIKGVVIVAETNYGADCFGLSAVRFVPPK